MPKDYVTGDTLELSCDLADFSKPVVWFRDGASLVPNNRTRVGQRMLRIINMSYEDSGVYSCQTAHNNALVRNYPIRVTGKAQALLLLDIRATRSRKSQYISSITAVLRSCWWKGVGGVSWEVVITKQAVD